MEVGDGDDVEVFFGQFIDHVGEGGEGSWIDGEGTVLELVVDVEVEGVGGDLVFAEAVGDSEDAGLGVVAVAGLLEAEAPEGRERGGAGEPGVGFDDVTWGGAVEEVVVDGAVGGAEGVGVGVLLAEVEGGAEGVVDEDAEGAALIEGDKEGNGFVDGVSGLLEAEGVGVPVSEGLIAAVEGAGLVAEAEEVLVGLHGFVEAEG